MTDAAPRGVLVWYWQAPVTALSSAAVGGGVSEPDWVFNIGVDSGYGRTDLAEHAREVATGLGLEGQGVALFTAANVDRPSRRAEDGVTVHATVGVSHPTWAAAGAPVPSDAGAKTGDPAQPGTDAPLPLIGGTARPGTINLVVQLPVALAGGGGVNAVITATEAKTQALVEAGVDGTGTATDAVVVVWPSAAAPERFAGPRSPWGERIARSVHAAVRAGLEE
ncbi:MAG: adenosylcobinamide amidohydrolase [Acidimicrobiia bacterium]|nr:adenosylcobinamide amidohydrolase [Acidimicrobiia bacterium]